MKNLVVASLLFSVLVSPHLSIANESVIERPSQGVINLPLPDENGKIPISLPGKGPNKGPRIIASCRLDNYSAQVIKENGQLRAVIRQTKNGVTSEKVIPYVLNKKLTKDMLGQYAAAVEVAQQLGITQVDYIKVYLVEPNIQFKKNRAMVFFYDVDDDIIDRTLIGTNQWVRCADEG